MTLGYVNLPEAGEQVDRAGRRRVLAVDQARDDLAAARRPHHYGAGTLDRWPGQRGVVGEGRRLAEERADAAARREVLDADRWTWATWRMRMMKNATTSSISKTSARALWSMSLKSAAFLASAPRSRLEMIRLPCAPLASKPATIVETPPPTCSPPPVPTYGTVPTVRLQYYI